MDALLSSLLLLSTLAISAFYITTGVSRFTSGRATGFTRLGAPHVRFPISAVLGSAELLLGVLLLVLPSPGSMAASYAALLGTSVCAWRAATSYRPRDQRQPGDITGAGLGTVIALCGVAVVAIADSLALRSAVVRLFDPANFSSIGILLLVAGAIAWLTRRQPSWVKGREDAPLGEAVAAL